MPDTDQDLDLDDLEYDPRDDDGEKVDLKKLPGSIAARPMTDEEKDLTVDEPLWRHEIFDPKEEAKYLANLGHRLTAGITRAQIRKMTIRDRMNARRQAFDMRQLLLDKPTMNVDFQTRKEFTEALPALQAEIERRRRESQTIDVTPNPGGSDGA